MSLQTFTTSLDEFLKTATNDVLLWVPRLILALIALFVFMWLGRKLERLLELSLKKRNFSETLKRFFGRLSRLGLILIGLALSLNIIGLGAFATGLLASGSIIALVLGFAFQQIGTNFMAGIFLAFSRPFEVGDLIECIGFQGIVKDIDLRATHIRAVDGRDIFLPNATIYTNPLINYTRDHLRRYSFTIGIDYGDDAMEALELLNKTAQSVEGVLAEPPAGGIILEFLTTVVNLEIFIWVSMDKGFNERRATLTKVMHKCHRALLEYGFTVSSNTITNISIRTKDNDPSRVLKPENQAL